MKTPLWCFCFQIRHFILLLLTFGFFAFHPIDMWGSGLGTSLWRVSFRSLWAHYLTFCLHFGDGAACSNGWYRIGRFRRFMESSWKSKKLNQCLGLKTTEQDINWTLTRQYSSQFLCSECCWREHPLTSFLADFFFKHLKWETDMFLGFDRNLHTSTSVLLEEEGFSHRWTRCWF